jgi:hypothetical protein
MAFAGPAASTHPAAASATLSFDFIVKPLSTNHRSRNQHLSYSSRVNYSQSVIFWTTDVL